MNQRIDQNRLWSTAEWWSTRYATNERKTAGFDASSVTLLSRAPHFCETEAEAAEHSTKHLCCTKPSTNRSVASSGANETRTARLAARNGASMSSADPMASTRHRSQHKSPNSRARTENDGDIIDNTALGQQFTNTGKKDSDSRVGLQSLFFC